MPWMEALQGDAIPNELLHWRPVAHEEDVLQVLRAQSHFRPKESSPPGLRPLVAAHVGVADVVDNVGSSQEHVAVLPTAIIGIGLDPWLKLRESESGAVGLHGLEGRLQGAIHEA